MGCCESSRRPSLQTLVGAGPDSLFESVWCFRRCPGRGQGVGGGRGGERRVKEGDSRTDPATIPRMMVTTDSGRYFAHLDSSRPGRRRSYNDDANVRIQNSGSTSAPFQGIQQAAGACVSRYEMWQGRGRPDPAAEEEVGAEDAHTQESHDHHQVPALGLLFQLHFLVALLPPHDPDETCTAKPDCKPGRLHLHHST